MISSLLCRMALARRAHPRFRLRRISVAGFALSVFSCTGFGKQASLFPCLKILARLIANAQKTPFAQMCKGRMSRGTTFSCKASLRISFFCNGKSRNHLLTEALISRFSSECTPPRHSLPDAFFLLWLQQSSSKATFRSCSPR